MDPLVEPLFPDVLLFPEVLLLLPSHCLDTVLKVNPGGHERHKC